MVDPAEARQIKSNPDYVSKHSLAVRLVTNSGEEKMGVVYLGKGQRVLDLLCDPKPFFPFRSGSNLLFINKASVQQMEMLPLAFVTERAHFFPGVDVDALRASLLENRGSFEVLR